MWGLLLAGYEAALASTGNVAASQSSASRSPSSGRRQPVHWLWCLLCLEADARDDLPDVFLPGTYYCSEALREQMLQGEKEGCTDMIRGMSEQGQRGRGWITFFDNTKQEMGKFNRDRKNTTCPVPFCSPPWAWTVPACHQGCTWSWHQFWSFHPLPRVYYTRCENKYNKLAWPSRPWKRPDSLYVCSYSAKFTSELLISNFWPDWQHHIRVRFSTEILFQTLLRGL